MLVALFSFRGCLTRPAYLGWSAAAFALVFAIGATYLLIGVGFAFAGFAGPGPAILGIAMAAAMMVVGSWSGLALAAKRIRDTGFDPFVVIAAIMTATVFDAVALTRLTEVRFFWPLDTQTPLGGIATIGYFLFALLWPSASAGPAWKSAAAPPWSVAAVGGVVLALVCVSLALLTPSRMFARERHALSQIAADAGAPFIAAALLRPLAAAGDARALNNLGALFVHGAGVGTDLAAARRMFLAAGTAGSVRARLNLALLRNGGCGLNTKASAASAAALHPLLGSDAAAPALIQDCLYFDATAQQLPDRNQRFIDSAARVQETGDPAALLQSGWALLNLARTTKIPTFGNAAETADYDRTVLPIARKAMELLFAAAEAGATGAYEPLGILSMQFGERLGNEPLAARLRDKSNWEWIEEGAAKGDWEGQCKVAQARINHLRWDGRDYARSEFDAAVALARGCIDRRVDTRAATWHDGEEWLAAAPRRPVLRPHLVIASLEAELNGFLFFDADKKLGARPARSDRQPGIRIGGTR